MEKRVQDYSKEILKIIRSNTSPAVMGGRLQDYHENDLAKMPDSYGQRMNSRLWHNTLQFIVLEKAWKK